MLLYCLLNGTGNIPQFGQTNTSLTVDQYKNTKDISVHDNFLLCSSVKVILRSFLTSCDEKKAFRSECGLDVFFFINDY